MAYKSRILLSLLTLFLSLYASADAVESPRRVIDLSGVWQYRLPDLPDSAIWKGISSRGTVTLPGTLDTNNAGIPVPLSDVTTQLSRRHTYTGRAVYSNAIDIPADLKGKRLILVMERTRPSSVKVDGKPAGSRNSISAPQRYDLTELLTPGHHDIEITVDNGESIPAAVRNNSHACAESTQTNWNGIIGDFQIIATDTFHLSGIKVRPSADNRSFIITGTVGSAGRNGKVTARSGASYAEIPAPESADSIFTLLLDMGDDAAKWSEWNPATHDIEVSLTDGNGNLLDRVTKRSGLRRFSTSGTHFTINGDTTFLRGRHDACVWPMTAHVPMDVESWRKYFETIKSYGINHVRFHSWCPPEACFQAADEAGVYLQPELPIWGEIDKERTQLLMFLDEDMENIMEEYASHPSFTMFAIGNELWGDIGLMKEFIDRARQLNPGLLATYGSNIYLGWNGHIDGEDFLVTCRVGGGEGYSTHARASFSYADAENGGIMNSTYPNSAMTFEGAISRSPVPVVGHETGQYQVYPDYSEIAKYKGTLRPDNLKTFLTRAEKAGTARKADDFFKASGKWAAKLYKADMEMNLRTKGMGGFQLLDIQDYPGQGTALVGILDAFMDSKGLVTPEEWRQSCDGLAVLAALPKYCFQAGENVEIPLMLVNYSNRDMDGTEVEWELPFAKGSSAASGGKGVMDAGSISVTLPDSDRPQKMSLSLKADNGTVANSYDIWVYPQVPDSESKEMAKVKVTTSLDEAMWMLENGDRVILFPDSATVAQATLGPLFQTDYWNYRMFKTICENVKKKPSPGTMGLLIDESHPVFGKFPTDGHTDWQWFATVHNSYPLIIDRLPAEFDPIVEPIDNVERNYRLALMFDCNVGKGKLLVVMADLHKIEQYPEGRWLVRSAKEYVASKKFKPTLTLTPRQLDNLMTRPSVSRKISELNNVSY